VRALRVIHGPNLRLLGRREPELYGSTTLGEIDVWLRARAVERGFSVHIDVTEHEGRIVELLHESLLGPLTAAGVLLNAGAYAHTSLAVADAVRAIAPIPVVEVHLTNTAARPGRDALVGEACRARVEGFGARSYLVALNGLCELVEG
jgi:3-dehydroquinate dehydratase-2